MSFGSNYRGTYKLGYSGCYGGGSGELLVCDVYVFTDAKPDRLDFATPFTGNLKILIGGTSTTGVNPAIPITGWIDSADLNPDTLIYNEIESNVTALDYIVDETFNGIVYAYAKDDVWYYVNMGVFTPQAIWSNQLIWS